MKLIVIIPAYNEGKTIGKTISEIPRHVKDVAWVEVMVIDDGSTDDTAANAKTSGADYVIKNIANQGLTRAFGSGLENALKKGADIIVNIDADGQYDPKEIPKLIAPILENKAHMVIGDRQVEKLDYMHWPNKYGNLFGSWVLRKILKNDVKDASSGFRAFSRECALRLNVFAGNTYTHQTIIQCVMDKMKIDQTPVAFRRREDGKSRLIKSVPAHIGKSIATIIRVYLTFRPLEVFLKLGLAVFAAGTLFELRFLWFEWTNQGGNHIQSVILGIGLIIIGVLFVIFGFLADLIASGKKINNEILYQFKKEFFKNNG
ncbi:glycosyltransferase family 2 protein [Candidatus Wolfebacteria bacterium]|nr:glycosyltransferase family 2 protein [Candidatus Wolfebacteria bacterium]